MKLAFFLILLILSPIFGYGVVLVTVPCVGIISGFLLGGISFLGALLTFISKY